MTGNRISVRLRETVLPPDSFAIVMATGIVSIAADDHGYRVVANILAVTASVAFIALFLAGAAQVVVRARETARAAGDLDRVLRAFTLVAGAAVLGVVWRSSGAVLGVASVIASVAWLVLVALATRCAARALVGDLAQKVAELRDRAHGAWLLISVGTSGLAATAIDLGIDHAGPALVWVGVVLWWVAWVTYLLVTGLIIASARHSRRLVAAMTPDQWILMGALAIAGLAGGHFVEATHSFVGLDAALAWVNAATIAIWAVTTAWIPVLAVLQVLRIARLPGTTRFANVWWSAVFPLGMYASASDLVGRLLGLPLLTAISLAFTWIALGAWLAAAVGLVRGALLR